MTDAPHSAPPPEELDTDLNDDQTEAQDEDLNDDVIDDRPADQDDDVNDEDADDGLDDDGLDDDGEGEAAAAPNAFAELGLSDELVGTLEDLGYEAPTPIQRRAIPLLLEGRDVLGSAATGTGKTAAFALPLVSRLEREVRGVQALVVTPTRELAMQVATAIERYGKHRRVPVAAVYGGQSYGPQFRALAGGVPVVVGTPGRLIDHLKRGSLDLSNLRYVVLDEADEMLDMGFAEDIDALMAAMPEGHQTALFSATFPPRIESLAKRHLTNPVRLEVEVAQADLGKVVQAAYTVYREHKPAALARVLDVESPGAAMVFCRTRNDVDALTENLGKRGFRPRALHGGLNQSQRDRVMVSFREGDADLLIATDVAARGLDVDHVSHVINYDIPESPETYVHRIGRTGRAGRTGTAITLVEPRERRLLNVIERVTQQRVEDRSVPTVAELRASERGRVERALRTAIETSQPDETIDDSDAVSAGPWAGLLATFAEAGIPAEAVAAAALNLIAAQHRRDPSPVEIPVWSAPPPRAVRDRGYDRAAPRPNHLKTRQAPPVHRTGAEAPFRPSAGEGPAKRPAPASTEPMAKLFLTIGSRQGVRAGDLVGAITGQARVPGSVVGVIEIGERSSRVEVAARVAEKVIEAIREANIRGHRVRIEHDRGR